MYTFLTAIVSLALIFIRVVRCGFYVEAASPNHNSTLNYSDDESLGMTYRDHMYPGCDNFSSPIVGGLAIVTVLFFFFTCCMLLEQGEAVDTNMSKIARMKTRAGMAGPGEYAPVATEFNEVFGGEHPTMSWHWFLPLPVKFPEWARDRVMGYEWDLTYDPDPYQETADTDGDTICSNLSGKSGRTAENMETPLMADVNEDDDVERGELRGGFDGPLEQDLRSEDDDAEEKDILPAKSDQSVKKRSSQGSFT